MCLQPYTSHKMKKETRKIGSLLIHLLPSILVLVVLNYHVLSTPPPPPLPCYLIEPMHGGMPSSMQQTLHLQQQQQQQQQDISEAEAGAPASHLEEDEDEEKIDEPEPIIMNSAIEDPADLPVMRETTVLLSRQNFTARYPARRFGQVQSRPGRVVVGVLSANHKSAQRQAIRESWAHGHDNVFFLVAGPWENVTAEFEEHQDLVWLDHPDEYYQITWSVLGFIHLAHKKIKTFSHLFKTDDDSYMRLEEVELLSATKYAESDYIGSCLRQNEPVSMLQDGYYPDYAAGFGYQISKSFAACISRSVSRIPSLTIEDGTIGVFAQYCQVPCVSVADFYETDPWTGWLPPNTMLVQHRTRTPEFMKYFHRIACTNPSIRNVNCVEPTYA